ncbi:MFS transporter [Candidatus Pseudothioglobus singularis]|jgi:MFS family permease|uniref:MFS transporter n=1 Tax=Candidatus Pseudothioglobus singularis PS1 TaxID=1125411 RepID=A0A0M3T1W0_9GAMM|nr:MFS transporter [Candidatus Pseudothioglobus singularis]ALE01761.1 MFS transporter [Candidatus Pseudothioglobus singularis PS1]ANQ66435.1 MFS transporter [Candidatus Pseudothioglobus singularis]
MDQAISSEQSKAYDNGVYATFLGAFLVLFQIGIYFVYIPWNAERLQITEAEIGMGLFAFGILNLIGNQISGRLIVPKIGTKNTIVIGLLGIAYCPLLLILSPNYYWFLISFMPFGFFVGLFSPSSQSQISMIESKTSRILTPLYHAAFSFGSLMGAFSAFFTIRYIDNPILIFSVTGTLLVIGAILIYKFGLNKSFENLEKTPRFKLPKKSILIFGILMMLNYATMGIILDWSALWLTKDLLVPLYLGGAVIFAFNIGEISARLIASKMINKASERIVGGYLSIAAGVMLFISILTSNFYIIVFGMLLFGFGTANFIAIIFRLAIRITDEPISLTVANLITLGFAGFIFGPALVGYLAEFLSLTFNMYLLSVVWGLNGVALLVMMKRVNSGN